MAEDNESENDSNETSIELSDLSDEQVEALSSHPEVQKMLRYEETSIPRVSAMLGNLQEADEGTDEAEAYDLLVTGIAERSGRITESTVQKVLTNLVNEYDSVK